MSDDNTAPGAPSAKAADREASDRVPSTKLSLPNSALAGIKQVDRVLLRLNKLLASPGGLSAFLSTFNYTLYVLAYLQTKSPALSALARRLLPPLATPPPPSSSSPPPPTKTSLGPEGSVPSLAALASLISRTRTTLRLFGLFPLYAWLRSLAAGPKPGADPVLHGIAVLQASAYFTFQALENVCVLADHGVVPPRVIGALNRGDCTTAKVYLFAYRCWLGGVCCDFLRLGREAQVEGRRRAARREMKEGGREVAAYQEGEDARVDRKWWLDLMIAGAWVPMAAHFSSAAGGIPGWNLGWMGVCGLVAGASRARGLWEATVGG